MSINPSLLGKSWRYYFQEKHLEWSEEIQESIRTLIRSLDDFGEVIEFNERLEWELALISASLGRPSKLVRHFVSLHEEHHIWLEQELSPFLDNGIVKGIEGRFVKITIE